MLLRLAAALGLIFVGLVVLALMLLWSGSRLTMIRLQWFVGSAATIVAVTSLVDVSLLGGLMLVLCTPLVPSLVDLMIPWGLDVVSRARAIQMLCFSNMNINLFSSISICFFFVSTAPLVVPRLVVGLGASFVIWLQVLGGQNAKVSAVGFTPLAKNLAGGISIVLDGLRLVTRLALEIINLIYCNKRRFGQLTCVVASFLRMQVADGVVTRVALWSWGFVARRSICDGVRCALGIRSVSCAVTAAALRVMRVVLLSRGIFSAGVVFSICRPVKTREATHVVWGANAKSTGDKKSNGSS